MPNNFTAAVKQHWKDMFQENLYKDLLAMEIAQEEDIPNGTTKNLPYISMQKSQQYVKYTSVTYEDIKTGDDQIVINQTPLIPFQIDRIDMDDNYLSVTPELLQDAGYQLKSVIDGDILAEADNADHIYDNRGLDPTSGSAAPVALTFTPSSSIGYIPTVFGKSRARLLAKGVNPSTLCMVIDSHTMDDLADLGIEKGYNMADESIERGYRGMFKGMHIYESNNLKATRTLTISAAVTANDTVTINGVTFKFVSTIGSDAGNVLIGANAAASRDNLVAAINGASGAGTTYVAIDEPADLSNITAVESGSTVVLTSNMGRMFASTSLTNASNKFGAESVECLITQKGAIRFALRNSVDIKQDSDPDSLVEKFKVWSRYGVKTPKRGRARMCRVSVQGDAAE